MNSVLIIGGGASGLVAAISAAREGAHVTLLEHKDRIGKKILSTGNGKCNLSNDDLSPDKYYSDSNSFAWKVISNFGKDETLDFFKGLGLTYKNRNGYIYPRSEQASVVLDLLRAKCAALNVNIICGIDIINIDFKDNDFVVKTAKGVFQSHKLIMALGGKSYAITGSDGSGYRFLDNTPHHISETLPALTGIVSNEKYFKSISGVRCPANIRFIVDNKELYSETGELQLTDYGLSGIPVFNGSRFISQGIYNHKKCKVIVDYFPESSIENLIKLLSESISRNPSFSVQEQIMGILNKKLSACILKLANININQTSCELKSDDIVKIANLIKNFEVEIIKVNSFDKAQITTGGVITDEINPDTLESKFINGLYIIGEMLDVDAMCGGYNLQFAWSTGIIAGHDAAK